VDGGGCSAGVADDGVDFPDIVLTYLADRDGDGVADNVETASGTSDLVADTDGDGLAHAAPR
jgi:hypothetical protein